MSRGLAGRILEVDLTNRQISDRIIDEKDMEMFIGGSGLAAAYLWRETDADTDPLSPENPLMLINGPFTGTPVPTSGRTAICTISPITNGWAESDVGGRWGTQLRRTGYDGVILKGKADKPVYLWITEEGCEIRDAEKVWGKDTFEADEVLRAETNERAITALIGPAGEKGVLYASIMTDGKDARAAGRCGVGTVMGSKNVKGLVAYGKQRPEVADPDALSEQLKGFPKKMVEKAHALHNFGTAGSMEAIERVGDLPIKNWAQGSFEEGATALSGQRVADTILTGRAHCGACPIGCGRVVHVKEGAYAGTESAGPEYESTAMLGSMCLVDDLEAMCKANEMCNRYGMDTISSGAAVSFAMECFDNGILTEEDIGFPLPWGSAEGLVKTIELIGERQGIGKILSQGVKRAAEEIGGLSPEYALHIKGLELPAHDPRAYASVGLAYATANRGACHLQGFTHVFERNVSAPEIGVPEPLDRFTSEGKGTFTALAQDWMSCMDSLKVCKFALFGGVTFTLLTDWYKWVTGWEVGVDGMQEIGERLYNLKRMINVRRGFSRKDDTLPERILQLRRMTGGAADYLPPLGSLMADYYEHRGWSEEGIPTQETLERLGLGDMVK